MLSRMDSLITVLDEDVPALTMLAKREWRGDHLDLQASAMFAEKIRTERARANAPARPARTTSRRPANGVAVAH